ncbi:MAG: carboxylesterase family protein [Candidatus Acidiferrales bacterium]
MRRTRLISRRQFLVESGSFAAASLLSSSALAANSSPVVKTSGGLLRGEINERGVLVFKGVPFAAPPVGQFRFRPPEKPLPWSGVRAATRFSPMSMQSVDEILKSNLPPMGEDCLYLNVWTPSAERAKRPVLFYIHGGAFVQGSGSAPDFDGTNLALNGDLVVVTINYRLGVFGFPPFRVFGDEVSNNLGLLDQIAALEWVRENIAAFGGDPGRVTISGLSAGGWSVAALMVIPKARQLFHRANPQSASMMTAQTPELQAFHARNFLEALGLNASELRKVTTLPAAALLKAQESAIDQFHKSEYYQLGDDQLPFIPARDATVLPVDPIESIKRGQCARVPLLAGGSAEELGSAPFRLALPQVKDWYQKRVTLEVLEHWVSRERAVQIWDGYAKDHPDASEAKIAGLIRTDFFYRMPSIRISEARSGEHRTWMYRFELRASAPVVGISTHATDMAFWFGNMDRSRVYQFLFGALASPEEQALSRQMQRGLAAFVRDGAAPWPAYDTLERQTMIYNTPSLLGADPAGNDRRLWDGLV